MSIKKNARFIGDVVTKWLKGNRKMKLLEKLLFIDSTGLEWLAPKGAVVDGASIPRFLWFFIGSPYSGKYRRASVIHDVYYTSKTRLRKQADKMFYEAMRVDGVNYFKAKSMYLGVRVGGGSRW
jgi:hypothetical protein